MKTFTGLKNLLLVGGIAGLFTGCAPTVTNLQLEPVSGDVATIDGRAVTKAERNGIGVVASFEREDLEFVTLDVEVKNRTDHPIEVNPADFHFVALGAAQDTLPDPHHAGLSYARSAADPTYEAGRMKLKRKQEEKRLQRAKVVNTILMVAAIASSASSAGNSRSYREYANSRAVQSLAYQGLAVKRAVDYTTFANRMQRFDYEEYRWRELALKTNTLAPGESIRGFIYLPKVTGASYVAINYSVPEQTAVPLLFRQEVVRPKKNQRR